MSSCDFEGGRGHVIKSNKFPVFFKIFIGTNLKIILILFHKYIIDTPLVNK